jgi:hypothetical protein
MVGSQNGTSDSPCFAPRHIDYTEKKFRRIINPQKAFITETFVYQRALPLDKLFFLKKPKKGLLYVAN